MSGPSIDVLVLVLILATIGITVHRPKDRIDSWDFRYDAMLPLITTILIGWCIFLEAYYGIWGEILKGLGTLK